MSKKRFNVTGLCVPHKHYMVDISGKLAQIRELIDEVDKTSNNRVFLNFLSMLRTKYLARSAGADYTCHSVILAGVYDIKNIKLKIMREEAGLMVEEEVKTYNSPWNSAIIYFCKSCCE